MWSFFHGWRRKAGAVTLVMACAVLGMWLRGRLYSDSIICRVASHQAIAIALDERSLQWISLSESDKSPKRQFVKDSQGRMQATAEYLIDPKLKIDWDFGSTERPPMLEASYWLDWNDFRFGIATGDLGETRILTMPYWTIVIPLTLLSAYLILWKPRSKQKTSAQLANPNINSD
ncbi:MAG: hypothetical protein JWP89_3777 [Schlesneria sp.]|nr:hypothetical protein [Schlesneria sp.]